MKRGRPRHPDILTPQQWRVLELLREGLTNEQIASRMGLTLDGAKYHVSEILGKLGVSSREEAARWADSASLPHVRVLAPVLWLTSGGPIRVAATITAIGVVIVTAVFALSMTRPHGADGRLGKIAYIQDGDLWVKELPNGTPRRLTEGGAVVRPVWSPSGEWIMYQRTPPAPGAEFGIWVVRADGNGLRHVVRQWTAAWSPIADVLVYSQPGSPTTLGSDVLLVENADGSGRRELLPAIAGGGTFDRRLNPVWSNDGRWVVFIEHRQDHNSPTGGYSYMGLRAVRDDGSGEHEIFAATIDRDSGVIGPQPLLWAVTGGEMPARLLPPATFGEPAEASGIPLNLMVEPVRGHPASLVESTAELLTIRDYVALSPDGRNLAFVSGVDLAVPDAPPDSRTILPAFDTGTDKAIAVLDLQTMSSIVLTSPDVVALSPEWSPDGNHIAYVARPDLGPRAAERRQGSC